MNKIIKPTILLIIGVIITVTTITGCGTTNKVYNVGTGELIKKSK
jgi:predicted small secreted protein|tara:strand:+ start:175 stop:309 length:135 start_codon:yes stop_codon:yes gene_type:complete